MPVKKYSAARNFLTPSIQHVADDTRLMTGLQENLRSRHSQSREKVVSSLVTGTRRAWWPPDLNLSGTFGVLAQGSLPSSLFFFAMTSDTERSGWRYAAVNRFFPGAIKVNERDT